MVNRIWSFFIISGIIFALITNNVNTINNEIIRSANVAFDLMLKIAPLIILWTGVIGIATDSGLLDLLARKLSPILKIIFPDIPDNHPALGYISSNIIINMFGLGNAATPFGLKTMNSLQELNSKKDEASRSMITFLVLNTSGVTIIPTTVISLRLMYGSVDPSEIIITAFLATLCSTIGGLIIDRIAYQIYH